MTKQQMKGIVLAGGSGSRLHPATSGISKQLLPIYDKPMIYYPISTLMLAGIQDILMITTPEEQFLFKRLLGDGSQFGCSFSYTVQEKPNGLAEAYLLAESFLAGAPSCLVLGDNIFFGHGFSGLILKAREAIIERGGATIFGYRVDNPSDFGVLECDDEGRVLSIEEKPQVPKSNYAITGLYFYDGQASQLAKQISPSSRGELEITALNQLYLDQNQLTVHMMGRGFAWLDTGTHESLMEASRFVSTVEHRQGLKIGCLEEIAYANAWIDESGLKAAGDAHKNSSYGTYLLGLLNDPERLAETKRGLV